MLTECARHAKLTACRLVPDVDLPVHFWKLEISVNENENENENERKRFETTQAIDFIMFTFSCQMYCIGTNSNTNIHSSSGSGF